MKSLIYFFIVFLGMSCSNSKSQDTITENIVSPIDSILPLQLTTWGRFKDLESIARLIPEFHFFLRKDTVTIQVGRTEMYKVPYEMTDFERILNEFDVSDFKQNADYFTPYFKYTGYMETIKTVDEKEYRSKYSSYKRGDIDVTYLELDSTNFEKFTSLSHYANNLALDILRDDIDKDTMITAYSLQEALRNPSKVYMLKLRNKKVSSLTSDIGKLTNLRVLDISGSRITALPPEIGQCEKLKSIIANASLLSEIPTTIGNLQQLRNINLGYCRVKSIPDELGQLTKLWSLNLDNNKLATLPESLTNLKNLMFFSASHNGLTAFPNAVLGMENVVNLWLHGNSFYTLPEEIKRLKEMSHFLVDAHEIQNIQDIRQLIPDVRIIDEEARRK